MISVLGLPLERATELLQNDGVFVSSIEARSKKGVEGGTQARVIRQTLTQEGHVTLVYSIFRTEPIESNA